MGELRLSNDLNTHSYIYRIDKTAIELFFEFFELSLPKKSSLLFTLCLHCVYTKLRLTTFSKFLVRVVYFLFVFLVTLPYQ
jgi:hypothetical protein